MVESEKRSDITQSPRSSAGADNLHDMHVARGVIQEHFRHRRPALDRTGHQKIADFLGGRRTPGSRVVTTFIPDAPSTSASIDTWVDLPPPSPPSKVMNLPVIDMRSTALTL